MLQIKETTAAAAAGISEVPRTVSRDRGVSRASASLCPARSSPAGSIGRRWRDRATGSLLHLARDAIIVWDELGADRQRGRAAVEAPARARQADASSSGEELLSHGTSFRKPQAGRTSVIFRELEIVTDPLAQPLHISTRPSMTFHGNMQVAVSEARSLVEHGGRVVFFAPSTGELERLADILSEYKIPFQLGIDTSETTAPYLAERAYLAGAVASTYLVKGGCGAASRSPIRS